MPSTVFSNTLGGLGTTEWNGIAGRNFYSTSAWLDHCAEPGATAGAAVTRRGARPAAAVPVTEFTGAPPVRYRWADLLASFGLPGIPPRGMLIGPPGGCQSHFLTPPGVDRYPAVATLVEEVRRLHQAGGNPDERACVAMYLGTADVLAAGVRAQPVLLGSEAWIDVPAGGWDAWTATLPAPERARVEQEATAFAAAGHTVTHHALAAAMTRIAPLVSARIAGELRQAGAALGDAARVAVCTRDGRTVGFSVYYQWRDTIYPRRVEFVAPAPDTAGHDSLAYHTHLRRARRTGVRRIHAGLATPPGATLRPLWLLELAGQSWLLPYARAIRGHNARWYQSLLADPRTAAAVTEPEAWLRFC